MVSMNWISISPLQVHRLATTQRDWYPLEQEDQAKLSIANAHPSEHRKGPSREQESESARLLGVSARLMSTEQQLFFLPRTDRRTQTGQHSAGQAPDH